MRRGPDVTNRRSLGPFFGRDIELGEIARLLDRSPVVTLVGAAGCGKTRLAAEAADAAMNAERFPDGVVWADLAPLDEGATPIEVAAELATAAGVVARPGSTILEQLAHRAASGRVLLVLDNCEHVVESVAEVLDRLVDADSGSRVLTTTQEAIRIAGETQVAVGPLPLPPAIDLFVSRVSDALPGFMLTGDNADAVREICTRLDGIPLALELAAAAAPTLELADLAGHLDERFGLLVSGRRTDMLRHQTLEAAIRWSVERLPPALTRTLGALSVFAGGFSMDGAAAVIGARASDVAALVAKSLVEREQSGRYRLLESIRLFALELLPPPEMESVQRAHFDWCLDLVRAEHGRVGGPEEAAAFTRLEAELGNLRAALVWALSRGNEPALGVEAVEKLARFWFLRGHFDDATRWLVAATSAAPDRRGHLGVVLGVVEQAQGRLQEAAAHFEEGVAAARRIEDHALLARSLHGVGHVAAVRGDYAAATGALAEARAEAGIAADTEATAGILHSQATVGMLRGDYAAVRELAEEGLAIAVEAGNRRAEALALLQLASADQVGGLVTDASRHLIRSLELARELDLPTVLATALGTLGNLAIRTGDPAEATRHYTESLAAARAMGDRRLEMITLNNLAEAARLSRRFDDARRLFGESIAISRQLGDRRAMAITHEALADIARDIGDLDGAAQLLSQSLLVRRDVGDRVGVASALDAVARLLERRSEADDAVRFVAAATARYAALAAVRPADDAAWVDGLVASTDPERVATLLAEGRAWDTEQAVERALDLLRARPVEPVVVEAAPPATVEAPVPAAVEVEVLGRFSVKRHGEPVPPRVWQSKKARDLLKMLVARRGQPVPRDQLIEALWPGDDPVPAANRLRVALSVLRSVLDPDKAQQTDYYVRSQGGAVSLDLDHVSVDVELFLNAVATGDRVTAETRYRGEALPEDVYEDWAVPLREEARVAYLGVATALLREAVARGDEATAARLSTRLLERDPYDERSHLALVRALADLGRHGDARRAHAAYTERMTEIGVEPEPLETIVA